MTFAIELLVSFLIVAGGVFVLIGSYGLLKLSNLMARLHAPTKATTLGVGGVLIASMIHFAVFADNVSIHELLITLFLFLTAPVTALFLAKAYLHRHRDEAGALPKPPGAEDWATFAPPPDGAPPLRDAPGARDETR